MTAIWCWSQNTGLTPSDALCFSSKALSSYLIDVYSKGNTTWIKSPVGHNSRSQGGQPWAVLNSITSFESSLETYMK